MISICVPYHDIPETGFFLNRLKESLYKQTYQNYELVLTKNGKMAENSNSAIKQANGEIIKILFMDDYLQSEKALQNILDNFKGGWLVSGCWHDMEGILSNPHVPEYTEDILTGNNKIGSPSVLTFENKDPKLFDENLSWLLDCDLYYRLHKRYGLPTVVESFDVAIGTGSHQTTRTMSAQHKMAEHKYLTTKYE